MALRSTGLVNAARLAHDLLTAVHEHGGCPATWSPPWAGANTEVVMLYDCFCKWCGGECGGSSATWLLMWVVWWGVRRLFYTTWLSSWVGGSTDVVLLLACTYVWEEYGGCSAAWLRQWVVWRGIQRLSGYMNCPRIYWGSSPTIWFSISGVLYSVGPNSSLMSAAIVCCHNVIMSDASPESRI